MVEQALNIEPNRNTEIYNPPGIDTLIVVGDLGPCGGVRMAIETTWIVLDRVDGKQPVFCNNPPVHNIPLMEAFEKKGLVYDPNSDNRKKGDIEIRSAHGSPPSTIERLRKRGIVVINTECQLVRRDRKHAENAVKRGEHVLYRGAKDHPEPHAVLDDLPKGAYTKITPDMDITTVDLPVGKIAAINQTTMSRIQMIKDTERLREARPDLNIIGPLGNCDATDFRQIGIEEALAGTAELEEAGTILKPPTKAVAIASKISHNGYELWKMLVERFGESNALMVDRIEDLDPSYFRPDDIVLLTASASSANYLDFIAWFMNGGAKTIKLKGREKEGLTFKLPLEDLASLDRYLMDRYGAIT